MKLRIIIIPALAVLAVLLFCAVLVLLPSTTLYEAKEDSFSENHLEPSITVLMTTNEADSIFPLMENMMQSSGKAVQYLVDLDMGYYNRELSIYKNYLSSLKKSIDTLNLTDTDLNEFRFAGENMRMSLDYLLSDYERIVKLMDDRSKNMSNPRVLASINNEFVLISAEVKLAVKTYIQAASVMIRIGNEYGLDTSPLRRAIELLTSHSIVTSPSSLVSSIISGVAYGPSQIYFVISPTSGVYGDNITVSGTAKAESKLQIFCDNTLWGYADVNENGKFSTVLTIGKISAGSHLITLLSETQISRSAELMVNMLDTNLNIVLVTPSSTDDRTVVTGILKTSTGIPVAGAPVSVINADDGDMLCAGITGNDGVWSASTVLSMGTYNVYAHFYNPEFPLYESRSNIVTFTVFGSHIYIILLILLAGSMGFVIWKSIKKGKSNKQIILKKTGSKQEVQSSTLDEEDVPEHDDELEDDEDEELFREMEEFEARSELDFLFGVPALSSLATISNAEDIWTMYRCVAISLAEKYNLSFVEAKTPRELLASIENASSILSKYLTEYEFIRYSGAAVTSDEFSRLKELALSIPEIAGGDKK